MYKVSLFVFTLLLLLACKQGTGNKSPEKAVMQRSKEDTLLTDDRGTDGWYLQKNANRDGGGYTIQTRKLNDSISSIRAVYFVKLDSITLGAGYDNAVKEIPLWEGGSRFEAARPIPKELLIHTAEVVTEGNGYYYEIVQGDTAKFKLIAFGESEDDKFGRQVYQYAYWIKWEGFFKYFERF